MGLVKLLLTSNCTGEALKHPSVAHKHEDPLEDMSPTEHPPSLMVYIYILYTVYMYNKH